MIKKLFALLVIASVILTASGCGKQSALNQSAVILPEQIEMVDKTENVQIKEGTSRNTVTVIFSRNISNSLKGDVLIYTNAKWEKALLKEDGNKLVIAPQESTRLSSAYRAIIVIPKTSVSGLKHDIYLRLVHKMTVPKTETGIVPVVVKKRLKEKAGCFCDTSALNLPKDIFLTPHQPFLVEGKTELHNGDSFTIKSSEEDRYSVVIRSVTNGVVNATLNKKYVKVLPEPLNETSVYFVYPKKLEGYIMEEIFTRKEMSQIKYIPYFPHITVRSFPGTGSDFTILNSGVFPLTEQDIATFELSDFAFGLRSIIHPPNFNNVYGLHENDIDALLRYEKQFKQETEDEIDSFVFPEKLSNIKPAVKQLFDKDASLSIIFLSHIKEMKHGKANAKWLNALILDLANSIGRNPEEKQKIKSLFGYPIKENFSDKEIENILNTNSNAWLHLVNLGNREVSKPIEDEIKAILSR